MPGRRGFLLLGTGEGIAALAAIVPRRPDERALTGVGQGAQPLDMRPPDFDESLARLVGNDRNAPVALICARGVRSARLAARLTRAGYTRIIDLPEGMPDSGAGPGWIARGLQVTPG